MVSQVCTMDPSLDTSPALVEACEMLRQVCVTNICPDKMLCRPHVRPVSLLLLVLCSSFLPILLSDACLYAIRVPLSIDPSLCLFHPLPPPIHLCVLHYTSTIFPSIHTTHPQCAVVSLPLQLLPYCIEKEQPLAIGIFLRRDT